MNSTETPSAKSAVSAKRKAKDSVFRALFKEKKYRYEFYKSIHPEDKDVTEDDIQDITLDDGVIFSAAYNDLGIMVGCVLIILAEAQSTWSKNLPVRCLIYLARSIENFLKQTKQNVYREYPVKIPRAEFYVIYTGDKDVPDEMSLAKDILNDENSPVELKVKVITKADKEYPDIIGQYIDFCELLDETRKEEDSDPVSAMKKVLDICFERGILTEFLSRNMEEVKNMLAEMFENRYSKEYRETELAACREDAYKDGYGNGYDKGFDSGHDSGIKETYNNNINVLMKKLKISRKEAEMLLTEDGN